MKPVYRPPKPSQASSNTLCQKCLKRDNYECTVPLQGRPYKARPSRTQQLLNPKLVPKLLSDDPNELLNKKGIADGVLATKETERGSKRASDNESEEGMARKRSRSLSTSSMDSVSTISTNHRRSPSSRRSYTPPHRTHSRSKRDDDMRAEPSRKRHRQSVSSSSISSHEAYRNRSRHTRKRYSTVSPGERGRRRSRSIDMEMHSSHSRRRDRIGSRRDSRSPRKRRRDRERKSRSLSRSPPRHKRRRSPTSRDKEKRNSYGESSYRDSSHAGYRHRNGRWDKPSPESPPAATEPRERSLSPYSKRVAMTQAMRMRR